MNRTSLTMTPIGVVHSPFATAAGMPIQAAFSDVVARVEIYPEYAEGLADVAGFDYLVLLYYFHLAPRESLRVKPFLDDQMRGVFATRAPTRPNRIGLSVVQLRRVEANVLEIGNADMVSGTPVLDVKPYVPEFDARPRGRVGWFEGKLSGAPSMRADGRMR